MSETSAIQNLLAGQLPAEEPERPALGTEKPGTPALSGSSATAAKNVLDEKHRTVLREILQRPSWALADFLALCGKTGLLPWAFVKALNEWALEACGDLLLEEGDEVLTVNQNLNKKIHV